MNNRVVVAGAGIMGASIAYHLAKRGAEVTVLEASERAGGLLGTILKDGFVVGTFNFRYVIKPPST